MKKFISLFTVLVLVMCFITTSPLVIKDASASSVVKYETVKKNYKINGEVVLKFKYKKPVLKGSSKAKKKINKYFKKLGDKYYKKALADTKDAYYSMSSDYKYMTTFDSGITLTKSRGVYSFKEKMYCYLYGSAHPLCSANGYNFSKSTGKKLSNSKLTKYSSKALKKKIVKASLKIINKNPSIYNLNAKDVVKSYKFSKYNCYLKGSYLYVNYQVYELASYAAMPGGVTVKVKL